MQHEVHASLEFHPAHLAALLLVLGAGAVYLRVWARNREELRKTIPAWRAAAFLCGLLFLWIASGSPFAALVHELLTMHMVQHLLLSTVAAPLLLLGEPVLLLSRGGRQRLDAPFAFPGAGWLTHPAFCWLAAIATILAWHVPPIFQLAMDSPRVHAFEQLSFFVTGLLFWWPVLRPWPATSVWPRWSIPLYLLLATMPCDVLSAFLTFCDRVVYPAYRDGPRQFQLSALQDQECAGALMWVWVTVVYLVPAVFITLQILAPPIRDAGGERGAA